MEKGSYLSDIGRTESGAEENGARGVHAIDDLIDAILSMQPASTLRRRAVETSGNALGGGGLGRRSPAICSMTNC